MGEVAFLFHKKKRFGQHFLKNKKILEEMARAAELTKHDIVLEVGPGLGHLTEILAARAEKVVSVEKDRDLIPFLREKFKDYKNVEIIEGDVLKIFNFQFSIFNQFKNSKIRNSLEIRNCKLEIPSNYKVVANLPYYITSRFLRIFLSETKFRTKLMVLMVQKEVAERICAKPPHMNLLALSVQLYAKAEIIRKVSKGSFSPPPKVDSAVIKLSPLILRGGWGVTNPEQILSLARLAFQQKRKMLRHSLKHTTWNLEHDSSSMLHDSRFNKRPEELSLEDWAWLTSAL